MPLRWYAVETKGGDNRAFNSLCELGREVYWPRYTERRLLRRRLVETTPPMFPGYLFVQIEGADYGPILRCRGVETILLMRRSTLWPKTGTKAQSAESWIGMPIPLRDREIDIMRAIERELNEHPPPDARKAVGKLAFGQRIAIKRADRWLLGLVDADEGQRIRVLLDILGGRVPSMVDRDSDQFELR